VCLKVTNTPQVREYADTHPDIWNGDVVSLVDRLMKAGQEADPQNIGPPFSILLITKKGSNWLRQNDCKAIETPSKKSESTKPRAGKYSHAKLNGFHLTSARA
jgi:hypothetical protein